MTKNIIRTFRKVGLKKPMSVPTTNPNYISETNHQAYFNTQPEGIPPPVSPPTYQPSVPVKNEPDNTYPSEFESQQQNVQYPIQFSNAPPQSSNPLQPNSISSDYNHYNLLLSESPNQQQFQQPAIYEQIQLSFGSNHQQPQLPVISIDVCKQSQDEPVTGRCPHCMQVMHFYHFIFFLFLFFLSLA